MNGNARPPVVTALGWTFIAIGALGIFGGVIGLLVSFFVPADFSAAGDAPPAFRRMFSLFRYFRWIAAAQLVCAAFTIWSGIEFLRLKAWARTALEGITWLGVVYSFASGAFWLWHVGSMKEEMPQAGPMLQLMIGTGIGTTLFYVLICGTIIYFLRSEPVRRALS